MTQEPLISLDNISLSLGGQLILDNVSAEIKRGEITTLIGPNGAGKSTLVKIALGLLSADSGKVSKQKGLRIGYVPQKLHLEQTLPLTVKRFLTLAKNYSKQEFDQTITLTDCRRLLNKQIHSLSGGELQRIMVTRALLNQPELLVLDEPAQGMDVSAQAELYQLVNRTAKRLNCAVLMVSHDLHLVMATSHHVLCINRHLCCSGKPESVNRHPEFARLFGRREQEQLAVYTHHHQHCEHNDGADNE